MHFWLQTIEIAAQIEFGVVFRIHILVLNGKTEQAAEQGNPFLCSPKVSSLPLCQHRLQHNRAMALLQKSEVESQGSRTLGIESGFPFLDRRFTFHCVC